MGVTIEIGGVAGHAFKHLPADCSNYHHEYATRDYTINRWSDTITKGDPYYSPNLALLIEDYSLTCKGSSIRPLAVLLDIFYLRPDLQRTYPEARKGDYWRLIDLTATCGTKADETRATLQPYGSYFASIASEHVEDFSTERNNRQNV